MQIRCANCGRGVPVADTGVLPPACPHCRDRPVPERLGRFRVVRLLAAGGMGEVYLGEHEHLRTRVAIKLLPLAAGDDVDGLRQRFWREAQLTAAIDHPGIVHVLDLCEEGGRLFLVLELVAGRSLRSRLRQEPLTVDAALQIVDAVADVLATAHAHGVVHRDVKPENIMLGSNGRVRVLDFGIARALQDQTPLTRTGEILGTPEYMAPEQLLDAAEATTTRTDVHALGVLAYELLSGRSPFRGQNLFQTLKLVESLVPPPPSTVRQATGAIPPAVDALVSSALAKDPAARDADAAAFRARLRACWSPPGDPTARPAPAGTAARARRGAALLAALVTGGLLGGLFGDLLADLLGWRARGPEPATPGPAPDLVRVDPRADLRGLAAASTIAVFDLPAARAALAATASDDDGDVARDRGRTLLRLGLPHAALRALDQAVRSGADDARGPAACSWHMVHTALPLLFGAPDWLAAMDRSRRDRLLDIGDDRAGGDQPLLRAARQLADGLPAAAFATLRAVPAADRGVEDALLAALAVRLACADRTLQRELLLPWTSAFAAPLLALLLADDGDVDDRLDALRRDAEPTAADRWLFELGQAFRRAGRDPAAAARIDATAELAWLCGAEALAPIWQVALRQQLGVDAAAARRLLRRIAAEDPVEHPAVVHVTAVLLLTANGGDDARTWLQQNRPGPALPLCARWLAADGAARPLFDAALRGDRSRTTDPADDATAVALRLWLDPRTDAQPQQQALWSAALAGDADLRTVVQARAQPVAATTLPALAAALADLDATAHPQSYRAALRLCVAAGLDVGALRQGHELEVRGGIE